MSRAKTTKAAKKRSVMGLYRHVGELLNRDKKHTPETLPNDVSPRSKESTDVK